MATGVVVDVDLQRDVMDEIEWDPAVDVTTVGVAVDEGVVTLTGMVDTFAKKWAAERATLRVTGVRAVANEIAVRPLGTGPRDDSQIAKAVADALESNSVVPAKRLHVRVTHGHVTLEGAVDWHYQRSAAERTARTIGGIQSLTNAIVIKQPVVSAIKVEDAIERALVRSAEVDAAAISVAVEGGHVTLTGTVRAWVERQEAEDTAWKAPGVTKVTNLIRIH